MKILVLNGSPKGTYSTTLHTCLYLEKRFPEHTFVVHHIGKKIRSIEADFAETQRLVEEADVLLFCYPVYTFLVPSQLHRFIELLKASQTNLKGKIATQVTTSKHFYDMTAHAFIEENCADMGLHFIDGLSADMDDLLTESGRKQAENWFRLLLWKIERKDFNNPVPFPEKSFQGTIVGKKESVKKHTGRKAVVVADFGIDDVAAREKLQSLVDAFCAVFPYECDVVDINQFPFKGGCLSCFHCAKTGKCIYADHFDDFLRENIHRHDAIVYAFSIKDHSMGSRFKMYDDRQFCNGHRTVTMGTPFGYLIDGQFSVEHNLRTVIEARAQVGGNYLAGIACTERNTERDVELLSERICFAFEHSYCPPQNFYGVGGMRIFRDLIYKMRGLMRADHKFFRDHGQYDFPQREWKTSLLMYLVGWMMNTPKIRAKMGSKINEGMIKEYRKVVEESGRTDITAK